MSAVKNKGIAEPKFVRRQVCGKLTTIEQQGTAQKRSHLPSKNTETPKKDAGKPKSITNGWSGKKRLSVVRDANNGSEQEYTATQSSTSRNELENIRHEGRPSQYKEYGFNDLIARHKSMTGGGMVAGYTEYCFKKNQKDLCSHRVASPELHSHKTRIIGCEYVVQVIPNQPAVQSSKENSVNKNNVQTRQNLQQTETLRTMNHTNKRKQSINVVEHDDTRPMSPTLTLKIDRNGIPTTNHLASTTHSIVIDSRPLLSMQALQTSQEISDRDLGHLRQAKKSILNSGTLSPRSGYQYQKDKTLGENIPQTAPNLHNLQQQYTQLKAKFVKYQRIVLDKQKQINRLQLENHNIKVEQKDLQTKINNSQEERERMSTMHTSYEGSIQQLKTEISNLKKQISNLKSKHLQDLGRNQKEVKEHYSKLIQEKNNQITNINITLKQKQSEIDNLKDQIRNLKTETQKSKQKEVQQERLIDHYRKQVKTLGVELFNSKKKFDTELKSKLQLQTTCSQLTKRIDTLNQSNKDLENLLKDRDKQWQQKLKQGQHEKNLLYDSLTSTLKNKQQEIQKLRKQAFKVEGSQKAFQQLDKEKQQVETLKKQVQELSTELANLRNSLARQSQEKLKLVNQKKQLTNTLIQRQRRDDEQKIKLFQSQSLKSLAVDKPITRNPEFQKLQKLTQQVSLKSQQIANLTKSMKSLQERYDTLEILLHSTNQQLFALRLQGYCKKLQHY